MVQAESIDHPFLDQIQRQSLFVGIVALAVCVVGALVSPEQFFRSYLFGYLFWIGIALGSIALVMLHHVVGGGWGFLIRRLLEAASRTMPLMALLFIPILAGMHYIFMWTHADLVAVDEILQHKQPYLNVPFFITRAVVYFLIWTGMVFFLSRWSLEQDRTGDLSLSRRLQMLSGPGLLLYGITVTFASIDWVMSLEPHWFSTIYGLLFIIGQALATMAFAIVMVAKLSDRKPLSDLASPKHLRDLGTLMFAFVMLWAYFSFSQWLIIWAGDLPEENSWYLSRIKGGWGWIALAVILFHFVLPFSLLLSRQIKRRAKVMMGVAIGMLFMRLVDLFWIVTPAFGGHGSHSAPVHIHWMDLAAPIGIGGLWLAFFAWQLKGKSLTPIKDPGLEEVLASAEGH